MSNECLEAQLRQTRILIAILGACVVTLAVATIWLALRHPVKTTAMVFKDRHGSVLIDAHQITFQTADGRSATLTAAELVLGAGHRHAYVSPITGIDLGHDGERIRIDGATIDLSTNGGHASLEAFEDGAELSVGKGIRATSNASGAHIGVVDGKNVWTSLEQTRVKR